MPPNHYCGSSFQVSESTLRWGSDPLRLMKRLIVRCSAAPGAALASDMLGALLCAREQRSEQSQQSKGKHSN